MNSVVLVVISYKGEMRLLDDALGAQNRLKDPMCGIIVNRVPADAAEFVQHRAKSCLEQQGVKVFGILPEERKLAALTVGEIINTLGAEVLTQEVDLAALVETLTVGAMTAEAALSRFRRYTNKAVITGGDRTDIQLAALETSTTCLVLTGNLQPSPLIIKHANELGVAILLVRENTMETVEVIENIHGKTRLGQPDKLNRFIELVETHVDIDGLIDCIGLWK
jgi:BioD-like phosphotransacetylase family protein